MTSTVCNRNLIFEPFRNSFETSLDANGFSVHLLKAVAAPQAYGAPGAAQFPGAGFYGGAQPQPASGYPGYPGYPGYGQPTGADA